MDKQKLRAKTRDLSHKLAKEGLANQNMEALAFAAVLNTVEVSIVLGSGRLEKLMDIINNFILFEMTGLELDSSEDFEKLLAEMQTYLAMAGNSPHGES